MNTISLIGAGKIGSPLKVMTTVNNQQVDITSNDISSVQWYRNGQMIDGANSLTYTPNSADQLAVLTADVTYKNAMTSVLSDQRAIDAQPVADTVLLTNSTTGQQFVADIMQTMATGTSMETPIGHYLPNMQNPQLVTIDTEHSGANGATTVSVDTATHSVFEQNLTTGVVQEMTYPAGLETPAARIAAGFRVVSTELDTNRDGQADILSVANNQLFINQSLTNSQLLQIDGQNDSLTANGGYEVKGVASFDGKGSDILLFNASHNSLEVLQLDGATVSARTALATLPAGSTVNSIGDINGDGKADILISDSLGNLSNLQMQVDQVNNQSVLSATLSSVDVSVTGLQTIPTAYKIIDRVDLNLDGKMDLLVENQATGQTLAGIMDGNQLKSYNVIESFKDWHVQSVTTDVVTGKMDLIFAKIDTVTQIDTGEIAVVPMTGVNGSDLQLGQAQSNHDAWGIGWGIDQADQITTVGLNNVLPASLFGM